MTTGLPGSPFPLGATVHSDSEHGGGTNFAAASEVAAGLTLCLFDAAGRETQVPMLDFDAGVWHTFVPGVKAGQAYGFRAQGPYEPAQGIRCNPAKLLLDPYAKAVDGSVQWDQAVFAYPFGHPDQRNDEDSAPHVPRSVVVNPFFSWDSDRHPRTPYHETVIYETHVRGL
ncbi:MAG TPA: glycogen debranching enzyme, partial [Streptosporangiaceae bacterium]